MPWDMGALIECRLLYEINNQKCMNVLHYTYEGTNPPTSVIVLQDLLSEFLWDPMIGVLIPSWRAITATNVMFTYGQVQQVYPRRFRASTVLIQQPGLKAGICHHQNIQGCITKLSNTATRHGQGGVRIGGLVSTDTANGMLTAECADLLAQLTGELKLTRLEPVSGLTYWPVIANKTQVPDSDPPRYQFSGFLDASIWFHHTESRTMARRTVGKGD